MCDNGPGNQEQSTQSSDKRKPSLLFDSGIIDKFYTKTDSLLMAFCKKGDVFRNIESIVTNEIAQYSDVPKSENMLKYPYLDFKTHAAIIQTRVAALFSHVSIMLAIFLFIIDEGASRILVNILIGIEVFLYLIIITLCLRMLTAYGFRGWVYFPEDMSSIDINGYKEWLDKNKPTTEHKEKYEGISKKFNEYHKNIIEDLALRYCLYRFSNWLAIVLTLSLFPVLLLKLACG